MMKLKFDVADRSQPDPFIFEDQGKLYLDVTAQAGVEAYSADDLFGLWHYEGIVTRFRDGHAFWAPSVIRYQGKYYMYVSFDTDTTFENLHVAVADTPLGPFTQEKRLFDHFSIDSHVVETDAGLFLWYVKEYLGEGRKGVRVYVDRLLDPWTPARQPVEKIIPTFDEEIYPPNCKDGIIWHTIEGPFWFQKEGWQYVMYSGGCFQDDSYHIGYAAAQSTEQDLTKVELIKHTKKGAFAPVLIKNEEEEGTGHNSVIFWKGAYYIIYHGRDYGSAGQDGYVEARTARVRKMDVQDGILKVL